jgi:hypothetical protein
LWDEIHANIRNAFLFHMFDKQADLSASTIAVFAQTESKIQYFGISIGYNLDWSMQLHFLSQPGTREIEI